jgi:hypothetical protein
MGGSVKSRNHSGVIRGHFHQPSPKRKNGAPAMTQTPPAAAQAPQGYEVLPGGRIAWMSPWRDTLATRCHITARRLLPPLPASLRRWETTDRMLLMHETFSLADVLAQNTFLQH